MSISRFVKLALLRVPAARRYAEAKWKLTEALEEAKAERDKLRQEVEDIGTASEADRDAALEQIQRALSDRKAVCDERDDLRLRLAEATRHLAENSAERDELRSRIATATVRADNLSVERENLRSQLATATARVDELSLERDRLMQRIEATEAKIGSLALEEQNSSKELKRREDEHRLQIEIAEASLTRAISENDRLRQTLAKSLSSQAKLTETEFSAVHEE